MLPPAVGGIALLVDLRPPRPARHGFGAGSRFTQAAVVARDLFVAGPFYVRPAIAAFEAVDPALLDAARTLGAGPARTSAGSRCRSPPAASARAPRSRSPAGSASSAPRSCSPAASRASPRRSRSRSTPQFDVDFDVALAIGALLVVVSRGDPAARQADPADGRAPSRRSPFPLRSFELELALELGARRSRSSGRRAPARRPCCARSPASRPARGARSCCDGEVWFDAGASTVAPEERRSGSSSRSTRSSRT